MMVAAEEFDASVLQHDVFYNGSTGSNRRRP